MVPEVVEDLGCYHLVSVIQHFIKEDGLNKREEHLCFDMNPYEEEIKDVVLNDERERHCCMVFNKNNEEVDGKKAFLYAIRWDVYNFYKEVLVKCGY